MSTLKQSNLLSRYQKSYFRNLNLSSSNEFIKSPVQARQRWWWLVSRQAVNYSSLTLLELFDVRSSTNLNIGSLIIFAQKSSDDNSEQLSSLKALLRSAVEAASQLHHVWHASKSVNQSVFDESSFKVCGEFLPKKSIRTEIKSS